MFFAPIRTVLFTFVIAIQFDLSDHALSPAEVSHRARETTTAETTTAETTTAEEGGKRGSSCPVPLPLRVSACLPLPLPSPCVLLFCLQQAQRTCKRSAAEPARRSRRRTEAVTMNKR